MKVIIAGGRNIDDPHAVFDAITKSGFSISEVVCGGARGADSFGSWWADRNDIPVKLFRPDWEQYGASAGPIRNRAMAKYAEALILVWDGQSNGSASMLTEAKKAKLKIYEYRLTFNSP